MQRDRSNCQRTLPSAARNTLYYENAIYNQLRAQAAAGSGTDSRGKRYPTLHREKEAAERDRRVHGAPGVLEGLQRPQGARVVQGGEEKPREAQGH